MNNELSFWQKKMADWGRPNDNGGSNYSDAELQYYLQDILKDYNDFIPTPVLRDAWRGARIREAQPMSGGTNYPDSNVFNRILREAIDSRLEQRNAPAGTMSPSGGDSYKMWNTDLSPTDVILRQIKLGQQQGSSKEYFPPIEQ